MTTPGTPQSSTGNSTRNRELLMLFVGTLGDGRTLLGPAQMSANNVSIDELYTLANEIAAIILGYIHAPSQIQTVLVAGGVMGGGLDGTGESNALGMTAEEIREFIWYLYSNAAREMAKARLASLPELTIENPAPPEVLELDNPEEKRDA